MTYYGLLDIEMTCDGKQENGKFIDDGRMDRFDREIISIGFIIVDNKYNIKAKYSSYVKPIINTVLTDYCMNLTGIKQADIDRGKKCDNAFHDIYDLCNQYSVDHVFTFGNFDKEIMLASAGKHKRANERYKNIYREASKIIDVRPAILKGINKRQRGGPGLVQIANDLGISSKDKCHDALGDTMLLYRVCKKLNIQMI